MMTAVRTLVSLLATPKPVVSVVVRLVDEIRSSVERLSTAEVESILGVVSDDFENPEVMDALCLALEHHPAYVMSFGRCAGTFALRAPSQFRGQLARILNHEASRGELIDRRAGIEPRDLDAIVQVARVLAARPGPRPGDGARAFLARLDQQH